MVTFGRPKREIDEKFMNVYRIWKERCLTATAATQAIGMTRTTFYRWVNGYEAAQNASH
ncbi:hypothetical protein [Aneurinibacillus migulanus]|uniref:hypothetical protein n=1 Tax=Aneurinibacillus migulanus TaxID=47500 RepID=UPI000ACDD036|nr:hypothetical protein [Aneurinibacillus migulanus]MCP1359115.1 hypothetical protein [Aneurinibacillus migulanus]MED0896319.1 hypothetical protein [Aneurinibacillus migulanus]MED1618638.1 hypothetical protein [Aneurinibacillus migulanus]MED4729696.1 hypothetical protein [Aneurinibacillus migulanus]